MAGKKFNPLDEWNDDLYSCLEHNELIICKKEDIKEILAEVPGENDEYSWWWLLKLKNRRFALVSAGCDYTGWDCQSSIRTEGLFRSIEAALKAAPAKEYTGRRIRKALRDQIEGKEVFGVYTEKN